MGKVYKSDYGVQVKVKTGIDLTGTLTCKLKISKPDGRTALWPQTGNANIQTPATDGILIYTTVQGDLDVAGSYKLQALVTFSGSSLLGETAVFKIYEEGQ
jgi:hypothetical protein